MSVWDETFELLNKASGNPPVKGKKDAAAPRRWVPYKFMKEHKDITNFDELWKLYQEVTPQSVLRSGPPKGKVSTVQGPKYFFGPEGGRGTPWTKKHKRKYDIDIEQPKFTGSGFPRAGDAPYREKVPKKPPVKKKELPKKRPKSIYHYIKL